MSLQTTLQTIFLNPILDSRKSFYKKAKVTIDGDTKTLTSYSTTVAKIENNQLFIFGEYSTTTTRHIRDFVYQYYSKSFDLSLNNIRETITNS